MRTPPGMTLRGGRSWLAPLLAALVLSCSADSASAREAAVPSGSAAAQAAAEADPLLRRLDAARPEWYDAQSKSWRRVTITAPEEKSAKDGADSRHGGRFSDEGGWSLPGHGWFSLSTLVFYLLAGLLAGLLLYAVAVALLRRRERMGGVLAAAAEAPVARYIPTLAGLDAGADPLALYAKMLEAGRWRQAIVCAYAALLLAYEDAGLLRLVPGRTSRAYRNRLREPEPRALLNELIVLSEEVIFGGRPAQRDNAERAGEILRAGQAAAAELFRLRAEEAERAAAAKAEKAANRKTPRPPHSGPPSSPTPPSRSSSTTRFPLRRTLPLLAAVLALAGCAKKIADDYDSPDPQSVNCFSVFREEFCARLGATVGTGLGDHRQNAQGLAHIRREAGFPPQEQLTWVRTWLEGGQQRVFLLVLRGDSLLQPLCRMWAAECDEELRRSPDPRLQEPLGQLRRAFLYYADSSRKWDDYFTQSPHEMPVFDGLKIQPVSAAHANRSAAAGGPLRGLAEGQACPPTWRPGNRFVAEQDWQPLCRVGTEALAVQWTASNGSRLICLLNGTCLANGALPSPQARAFTDALLKELARERRQEEERHPVLQQLPRVSQKNGKWVFLKRMDLWDGTLRGRGMLESLLMVWPFNFVFLHLLALLGILAWSRSLWLGRRDAGEAGDRPGLVRHVAALGRALERVNGWRDALRAIGEWRGAALKAQTPEQARELARKCLSAGAPAEVRKRKDILKKG